MGVGLWGVPKVSGAPPFLPEDDIPRLIQTIDLVNDPAFLNNTQEVCQTQCVVVQKLDPLEQCAVDLCGSPEDSPALVFKLNDTDYDNVSGKLLKQLEKEFEDNIQPSVEKAMEERKRKARLLLEQTNRKMAQQRALEANGYPPDPETMKYLNEVKEGIEERLSNPIKWMFKGLNKCKSQFVEDSLRYNSVEDFMQNKSKYIDQFINNMRANYSEESTNLFSKYVDNQIEFEFPDDPKTYILENIKKYEDKIDREWVFDVCPSFVLSVGGDSVIYPSGVEPKAKLSVSLFSCQFHEHGKEVFAHELGHILSFRFASAELSPESYIQYMSLRKCTQNRYNDDGSIAERKKALQHPGDKLQTEEGMADLISSLTFLHRNGSLANCSLLDYGDSGNGTWVEVPGSNGLRSRYEPGL